MIDYDFGTWGIHTVLQAKGSVFQRSMVMAFLPTVVTAIVTYWYNRIYYDFTDEDREPPDAKGLVSLWGTFTFILGFLLVFRTQIAYSRYWEGIKNLMAVRSVWLNAMSNLVAFTTRAEERKEEARTFQQVLIRLFSLLYSTAISQVAVTMGDENFFVLEGMDDNVLDPHHMEHFYNSPDRTEVLLQWIQTLMVEQHRAGVLDVAPPILSRVYQELSNGVGQLYQACTIAEVMFPFPYAQMVTAMLLLHWVCTPFICSVVLHREVYACVICFTTITGLWSLNFISAEIEMPFGDDPNDLPLKDLLDQFNRKLCALMSPVAQCPPDLMSAQAVHHHTIQLRSAVSVQSLEYQMTHHLPPKEKARRKTHWSVVHADAWERDLVERCASRASIDALPKGHTTSMMRRGTADPPQPKSTPNIGTTDQRTDVKIGYEAPADGGNADSRLREGTNHTRSDNSPLRGGAAARESPRSARSARSARTSASSNPGGQAHI